MQEKKSDSLQTGVYVFIALLVLTGLEYWVAVGNIAASLPLLIVINLAKATVIIVYYMHIQGIFSNEGGH
jgi:heme/copper-type cytochrome/quinol oxidase subunit 4